MIADPSGPIVILCGINASGEVEPCTIDADGALVTAGATTEVDASDVTYTPTTPADWDGGVDPGNQDSANDQLAERVKDIEDVFDTSLLPARFYLLHAAVYILSGNAISWSVMTGHSMYSVWSQAASANGDQWSFSTPLKAGSYTWAITGVTNTDHGIIDLEFKHVSAGSFTSIVSGQDWYSGALTKEVTKTATFTVTTPGRYIFRATVNGKHASSSSYDIELTYHSIYLTAGDS